MKSNYLTLLRKGLRLFSQSYWARNPRLSRFEPRKSPLVHWILFGSRRGANLLPPISPFMEGNSLGVRFKSPSVNTDTASAAAVLPKFLLEEIETQAAFEPLLLAAGASALKNLPVYQALEYDGRSGLNFSKVEKIWSETYQSVLLVPHIAIGGADKYALDLVNGLNAMENGKTLVIATLPSAIDLGEKRKWSNQDWPEMADLLIWSDFAGARAADPFALALFLNAVKPLRIVNINSRLGYDTLEKFGDGLTQNIECFATFFTTEWTRFSGLYVSRYCRTMNPRIRMLTDNKKSADRISNLLGPNSPTRVHLLPAKIAANSQLTLDEAHAAVESRMSSPRVKKWLWISRVEAFKGTEVLGALAKLRPHDVFEVFGPLENSALGGLGLKHANIKYRGVVALEDLKPEEYVGFLFTSFFEGLPNVVLEITQLGIPIISTDVGDLRNELGEKGAMFVELAQDANLTAAAFNIACDNLIAANPRDVAKQVMAAGHVVTMTHSPDVFQKRLTEVFERGN